MAVVNSYLETVIVAEWKGGPVVYYYLEIGIVAKRQDYSVVHILYLETVIVAECLDNFIG
jgi:hypothetical protein